MNPAKRKIFATRTTARPIVQRGIKQGYPRGVVGWQATIKVTPNRLLANLLPEEYRMVFYEISDVCGTEEDAVSQARARLEARIGPVRERVKESLTKYVYAVAIYPNEYTEIAPAMKKSGVDFVITQLCGEQRIEILAKRGVPFGFFTGIDLYPEPVREEYREKIDKCWYPVV